MSFAEVMKTAIGPALELLPKGFDSKAARAMLLAIGMQESRLTFRRQIGGPAVGFWQFEKGGGVKGVMTHPLSTEHAKAVCASRGVPFSSDAIYKALPTDDVLAAAFARLLLWTDPKPLPGQSDAEGGWECYQRNWRPGKPHRETWDDFYNSAVKFAYGA